MAVSVRAAAARSAADLHAPAQLPPACPEASIVLLRCPRCGLEMQARARWLAVEYCPRCIARSRIAVRLREG